VAAGKNLSFRHFSIGVTRFRPGFPKLLPKQPIGRTSRSLAPARDRCRRQITVMDFPSRCVRTAGGPCTVRESSAPKAGANRRERCDLFAQFAATAHALTIR